VPSSRVRLQTWATARSQCSGLWSRSSTTWRSDALRALAGVGRGWAVHTGRPLSSVVGGPGPTEKLTGPRGPDRPGQLGVVLVDHLVSCSLVSALLEMSSKSA